jgi:hypothetical protein
MWSRQDLREGATRLLDLDNASEDRLIGCMAAVLRLSEASRADDGLSWEVIRTFIVLVTTIAESDGVLVSLENSTELAGKATLVLRDALESAHRKARGLPALPLSEDWENFGSFED